ncbi:MAG: hypothetical protein ACXVIS_01495 [Halobacteriota archaeon]
MNLKKAFFGTLLQLNAPYILLKQTIKSERRLYLNENRYNPLTKAEINHFMIILNILGLDPLSSLVFSHLLAMNKALQAGSNGLKDP